MKLPRKVDRSAFTRTVAVTVAMLMVACIAVTAHAQRPGEEEIELNLSGSTKLPVLIEVISKYLDTRYVFGEDMENRLVTIITPAKIPKSAIEPLFGAVLRSNNLALVDTRVPGWKRIVDIKKFKDHAKIGEADEAIQRNGPAAVVTQVITVKNVELTTITRALDAFKSDGGIFISLPESGVIIVTDYAETVKQIAELVDLIDLPRGQAVMEFYDATNRKPAALIEQVEALLGQESDAESADLGDVRLFNDASGRRVVIAGDKDRVDSVLQLLQQLDTGTDFVTQMYRLQNVSASRIETLTKALVSTGESETAIETTIDEDGNILIVRAPADVHRQIERLIRELDQPVDVTESPIRFYKLRNANATEVLFSLLALQQVTGGSQVAGFGGLGFGAFGTLGGVNVGGITPGFGFGSGGFAPSTGVVTPGGNPLTGLGGFGLGNQAFTMGLNSGAAPNAFGGSRIDQVNAEEDATAGALARGAATGFAGAGGFGGGQVATLPGGARVSADPATNSLIVYAPASVQPLYEKLIQSLDQRRPQVMIEADIIAVDTTDDFSLGVEISIGDRIGANKFFKFTSFGLSSVDPLTGMLTPIPSRGFNGVVLQPEIADAIIQALVNHTRSRNLASPKILVNDNQTGNLEAVVSIPFGAQNTINTATSVTLGGEQSAGTIITVTPHINEDDHLQLEFDVEFSSFSDAGGSQGLPPPRQVDRVSSVVTIPDGHTVVVGGLKRFLDADTFQGVPWTEKIPILRELTSLKTEDKASTSFFLFIRPKILRDSRFRDLQFLSNVDIQDAQIDGDYPSSRPILIPCPKPPNPEPQMMPPGRMPPGRMPPDRMPHHSSPMMSPDNMPYHHSPPMPDPMDW